MDKLSYRAIVISGSLLCNYQQVFQLRANVKCELSAVTSERNCENNMVCQLAATSRVISFIFSTMFIFETAVAFRNNSLKKENEHMKASGS